MAKNILIKNARDEAKKMGVSAAGWGDYVISFFVPKTEELLSELTKKMNLLGLQMANDEGDKETGLVSFADRSPEELDIALAEKRKTLKYQPYIFLMVMILAMFLIIFLYAYIMQ